MQIIFNEVSAGLTFNMKVVSCLRDQGPRPGKTHRKHQGHPIAAVSRGIASPLHRAKKTWGLLGFYPVSFLSKLSPKQVAGGSEDDKSALKPGKDSEKDRWERKISLTGEKEASNSSIYPSPEESEECAIRANQWGGGRSTKASSSVCMWWVFRRCFPLNNTRQMFCTNEIIHHGRNALGFCDDRKPAEFTEHTDASKDRQILSIYWPSAV